MIQGHFNRFNMENKEVSEFHSSPNNYSVSSDTSFPCCINLLGVNKAKKAQIIQEAYRQFIQCGKESSIITTMATSSELFQFVLNHTPQITFLLGRLKKQNKRYDAMILKFCH